MSRLCPGLPDFAALSRNPARLHKWRCGTSINSVYYRISVRISRYLVGVAIHNRPKVGVVIRKWAWSINFACVNSILFVVPVSPLINLATMKHYDPEPMIIAERFLFYQHDQKTGESIADYLASLLSLCILHTSLSCKASVWNVPNLHLLAKCRHKEWKLPPIRLRSSREAVLHPSWLLTHLPNPVVGVSEETTIKKIVNVSHQCADQSNQGNTPKGKPRKQSGCPLQSLIRPQTVEKNLCLWSRTRQSWRSMGNPSPWRWTLEQLSPWLQCQLWPHFSPTPRCNLLASSSRPTLESRFP